MYTSGLFHLLLTVISLNALNKWRFIGWDNFVLGLAQWSYWLQNSHYSKFRENGSHIANIFKKSWAWISVAPTLCLLYHSLGIRVSTLPLTFLSLYYAVLIPVPVLACPFFSTHPRNYNHHKGSHFVLFFSGFHCALYNSLSTVCRTPYLLNLSEISTASW